MTGRDAVGADGKLEVLGGGEVGKPTPMGELPAYMKK